MAERKSRDRAAVMGYRLRAGDPEVLAEVLAAYRKHRGHEGRAAEELDLTRKTLVNWRDRVPALNEGVEEIRALAKAARIALRAAKKPKRSRTKQEAQPTSAPPNAG